MKPSDYKLVQRKLALFRGFVVAIAQLLFYTALGQLELATVSALGQTNALFVVLLVIIMYREQVGIWRWGAVVIGFIGALWIVRPGSDVFSWIALFPIGAAFCYAFSVVSLRSFDRSISNSILYLYSAFAAAIGAIFFALFTNSFSPILSLFDAGLILSMSICGGFGVIFFNDRIPASRRNGSGTVQLFWNTHRLFLWLAAIWRVADRQIVPRCHSDYRIGFINPLARTTRQRLGPAC